MGIDCSIYSFPPGRCFRTKQLDRRWAFAPVIDLLDGKIRASAASMLTAVETAPFYAEHEDYQRHWRGEAQKFLLRIIARWGPETPCLIQDDIVDVVLDNWWEHPVIERFRRRYKTFP